MLVIITTVNYAYCYSKYMLSCNTDTVKYGKRAGFFFYSPVPYPHYLLCTIVITITGY